MAKQYPKRIARLNPRHVRYSVATASKKTGRNSIASGNNSQQAAGRVFATHMAPEFLNVAKFISDKFGKDVYIIGIRSVYEQGVKPWRVTEDYDIYSPLSKEERDELSEAVTKKFGGSYQWTSFGTIYRLADEEIDVNLANPIPDAALKKRARKMIDNIYAISIEDLIVMKLTSPRKKDRTDVGKILRNARGQYDISILLGESERAGVAKELVKIAKRYGVDLQR